MSFELSAEEQLIVDAVRELAAGPNGRAHWRERALANAFPERLWQALADAGYLGLLVPPEHGGAGLGLREMAVLMEAMAAEGMALLLMIVSTVMSTIALARHGSPEQKRRYLPGLARGTTRICFAITEPNAGSNSFRLETLATREGDGYRIRGQKYFISGVEQAQHVLLVTRTTPAREVDDKRAGLSLLIVDTDAPGFTKHVQDTALNETERQWTLFLDDVRVPRASLVKTAPVSREMILNYIGEHVLGLPGSY